jgi:hypothetical protein
MIVVINIYQIVTNANSTSIEAMDEDIISNTYAISILPASNYEPLIELEEKEGYFIIRSINIYGVQFKRRKLTSCRIRAPDRIKILFILNYF